MPLAQTIAPPPAAEGVQPNVELTAESESEIEISAEAETLVEASVAPVTYQRPDEISVAEAVPIDEMAGQLRGGAWRSAIPTEGDAATRLTPALIQAPARPERRLSMHRIGLVVAAVGALAALVYSVRLSPGTGSPPAPIDASAPPPAVVPAPRAADVAAPAASVAAMPDPGAARSVDASPPAPLPATARGDSRENAPSAPPASIARTEAQAPVAATPVPAPRPAPAPAATREATAPPVMRARRPTVETPRTCTPAIAALGLCTLESNPEGK
ncbi:MAG TPA: hypothetical protein VMG60_07020 [Burkholderiaceae bacterium]|nr:hypothetical protein [Burkholderiaceae bacterium]